MKNINIAKIQASEVKDIADLIEQYREFYKAPAKPRVELVKFFENRLKNEQSIIWVALENNNPVGFAQIYKSYTTVGLGELWILNDLYVEKESRKQGVADLLISTILQEAKESKILRVDLKTAFDNVAAKALYNKVGFKKDEHFEYFQINI